MKIAAIAAACFVVAFLITVGQRFPISQKLQIVTEEMKQMAYAIDDSHDSTDLLKRQLDKGADPNGLVENTADMMNGLRFGYELEPKTMPALQYALKNCRSEAVEVLVRRGADWKRLSMPKDMLLYCAARTSTPLMKEMIESGMDPNMPIGNEKTHLLYEMASGEVFSGYRPRNYSGPTTEYEAFKKREEYIAKQRRKEFVAAGEWLIDKGADVNLQGGDGESALHRAARDTQDTLYLQMLIRKGADVNLKDRQGHTPLDSAMLAINKNAVAVLKKAGGKLSGVKTMNTVGDISSMLKKYGAKDVR